MLEFTCVVCPWGCSLIVESENISGYSCSRGLAYAKNEQTDPRRDISGTVRVTGAAHPVIPVKTSSPIPKDLLLDAAELLRKTSISAPIKTGDVIIANMLGTGIDFIAARSIEAV
ncbi:MAG: DUF1667 domain-containing protein [Oscillospiraceae bacterium]|nr:DUF1667 domain-containing protein [Oscillospiraceae bacterium]